MSLHLLAGRPSPSAPPAPARAAYWRQKYLQLGKRAFITQRAVRLDVRMDYGPTLSCLGRWLTDPNDRDTVLWKTPARLFGFKEGLA